MGDGRFRIACVQHCAGLDVATNLATLARLIEQAVARGADLVCLPEYCAAYGMKDGRLDVGARAEDQHEALQALRGQARRHRCWLLIGSIGVLAEDGRILNRSYLVDSDGVIRARYDKIHLFDVDLTRGESYRESGTIRPGESATVVATPFGRLGLTVCYDLRFPHLYRALAKAGADVLFVPAAFTRTTGQAHWHVLLRARAIETGAFVLAPSQCGEAPDGKLARYGHSLIVDPWGEVLADGGEAEGVIAAELDRARVAEARRMIPALRHDRVFEVQTTGES
jgi:deaminated glutathione amidase